MKEIVFVTHNPGKIDSAYRYIRNAKLEIFRYDLEEPRSDDIRYISEYKVRQAFALVHKPCISMDAGFFVDALNGFPRAYVNFMLDTVGIDGLLKRMDGVSDRRCRFVESLSYWDGETLLHFPGEHPGRLAEEKRGADREKKWSDLWTLFIPDGSEKTLAEMTDAERENRPRPGSTEAMKLFAKWLETQN